MVHNSRCAESLLLTLSTGKQESLPSKARTSLRTVWQTVFDTGWDACEFEGNGSHIGFASIVREKELFPQPQTYRGVTEVYGRCVRAGGESRRTAQIRLLDGSWLHVRLRTRELAEELGKRLYQIVGLRGEAIWSAKDRSIERFRADSLTPYKIKPDTERSVCGSFDALAKAAGTRWDNVDPEEFVAEQRRD